MRIRTSPWPGTGIGCSDATNDAGSPKEAPTMVRIQVSPNKGTRLLADLRRITSKRAGADWSTGSPGNIVCSARLSEWASGVRDVHRRHVLRDGGTFLRRHRALEPFTALQPLPIGPYRRLEGSFQSDVLGEQKCISYRHVRRSEPSGTYKLIALEPGGERSQPGQKPLRVVIDDLRLLAL